MKLYTTTKNDTYFTKLGYPTLTECQGYMETKVLDI